MVQWKNTGGLKQKHKKQPFGDASASHLSLVLWHGNSFPMTQSAQSHRQMRSIPRCPKAVFYVFVFYSIHDSATKYNLSPQIFH